MKWFDNWFAKKCRQAWENSKDVQGIAKEARLVAVEDDSWSDGLRINVKKMIGGHVVSFRTYDRKTDRSHDRNYIITDEQDFDRELGKVITLESMRHTSL